MELLEDPEVKLTYEKCKYKVKLWEHKFKKKNGRIPSKLDIKESSREVRQAYKTYFQLKSAALEQSLMDIDDFNFDDGTPESTYNSSETVNKNLSLNTTDSSKDITTSTNDDFSVQKKSENNENTNSENTWGIHLNNPKEADKNTPDSKPAPDINNTLSQKLFCGSKFAKRNPRKSKSFCKKKSENNISFFSQPLMDNAPTDHEFINSENLLDPILKANFKVQAAKVEVKCKSLNIVQNICDNAVRPRSNLDFGWISRMTVENNLKDDSLVDITDFPLTSQFDSDDDVIEDSDEEKSKSIQSFSKKPRLSNFGKTESKRLDFSNIFPNKNNPFENILNKNESAIKNQTPKKCLEIIEFTSPESKSSKISVALRRSPRKNPIIPKSIPKVIQNPTIESKIINTASRKSTRTSKKVINDIQKELSDEEVEDPFANASDEDPEFDIRQEKGKSKLNDKFDDENTKKPTRNKKRQSKEIKKASPRVQLTKNTRSKSKAIAEKTENDDESSEYILEYSVKPRIKTVPRNKDLKKVISNNKKKQQNIQDNQEDVEKDDVPLIKDKRTVAKEKLEQKVASGKLNDNFVTINIKKKVFVRGKKHNNFSKYKKNAWKKLKAMATSGPEMDMRGCDGGMLTCFKCGQVGHFAQNCKTQIGDSLLPLSVMQTEEPCPYPTLEEAAKITEEQNKELNIRKSTRNFETSNKKIILNEAAAKDNDVIESTEEDIDNDNPQDPFNDSDDDLLLAETLSIEKYLTQFDIQKYVDKTDEISPVYELCHDGSLIDAPIEVFEALNLFGFKKFRPGQELAVMRILSGKSTLVTLSTGSGKSLCYQLPAYLYSKQTGQRCISLVISPLVSLMEDQVTGIPHFLNAACLHTNKTKIQRDKILEEIREGNLDILLVSPEAIVAGEKSTGFGSLLRHLPPIAFACIDEAHCLSQWSHNFRPSYLMLSRILRERLGVKTILGLTATATRATCASIVSHLGIQDGDHGGIIKDRPLPDNIRLTVSRDIARDKALLSLILSEEFKSCTSIIVYCTRREECERIASYLRTCLANVSRTNIKENSEIEVNTKKRKRNRENIHAEPYHAGLAASKRRTIQKLFMSGELRIVVATVAFGMGINKSDIRSVIHYNMPKNFESYVQEVGRAGRDGRPAHCHLFMDPRGQDMNELQRHIHANSIDRHVIRKLLQKIFIPCSCKPGNCPKHEVAFSIPETVLALDVPEENIATLLCYLELHDKRFIEVLSPAYTLCKIISYGGPNQIGKAAKECPPLAMGLALYPPSLKNTNTKVSSNVAEFPVIEIAAAIGWDSGICKHKLKNLEWLTEQGQPKRSTLSVQFSQLGFRLLAPGNLTDDELDAALDSLFSRVTSQERTAVSQLRAVHTALSEAAETNYKICLTNNKDENEENYEIIKKEGRLKERVRKYFDGAENFEEESTFSTSGLQNQAESDPDRIAADTRALICLYRDNSFTGRAVARIFHGIQSPNFPAVIWGRCKFWRAHLTEDFNEICKIATAEIIKMR